MAQFVLLKRLYGEVLIPKRNSEGAAGFDLYSVSETKIGPHQTEKVSTGLAIYFGDKGIYAHILARSSTIFKWNILIINGVIDCDYRGELKIVAHNLGSEDVYIPKNTAIAQIIFEKISTPHFLLETEKLPHSDRDKGGFGSTDVQNERK